MFGKFMDQPYHDIGPFTGWHQPFPPPKGSGYGSQMSSFSSAARPPVVVKDFRTILRDVAPMIDRVKVAVLRENQRISPFVTLLCWTLEDSFKSILEESSISWDFVFNVVNTLNYRLNFILNMSQRMNYAGLIDPRLNHICASIASQTQVFLKQNASVNASIKSDVQQLNLAMVHLLSNVGQALGSNPPGFFDFLGHEASSAMLTIVSHLTQA